MGRARLVGLLAVVWVCASAAAEDARTGKHRPVFLGSGGELKVLIQPEFRDAPSLLEDLKAAAVPGLVAELAGPTVAVPPEPGKPPPPPVPRRILLRGPPEAISAARVALRRLDLPRPTARVSLLLCETRCRARTETGGSLNLDRRAYPGEGSDTIFGGAEATFEPESYLRSTLTGVRPFDGTSVTFAHGSGFETVLRMLQRRGEAEFLVQPSLVLTEEEPGSIESIVSLPQILVERAGLEHNVGIESVDTGVHLEARALRIGRDHVVLELVVWIRIAEPATGPDQDPRTLVLHTREVKTHVTVRDGAAALLGGLKIRRRVGSRQGLPGLSRVPSLTPFLSSYGGEIEDSELVLLVEPRILVPGSGELPRVGSERPTPGR